MFPNLYDFISLFLFLSTQWKSTGLKTILDPTDFHCVERKKERNFAILPIIFFVKNERFTGLEQHEDE